MEEGQKNFEAASKTLKQELKRFEVSSHWPVNVVMAAGVCV